MGEVQCVGREAQVVLGAASLLVDGSVEMAIDDI